MGAWVELNGAFSSDVYQDTDGYSVCVKEAELLSYNEYVERYSTDAEVGQIEGLDEKALVCVTLGIRNEDSSGGLSLFTMYLVPDRKNEYFVADTNLLLASETKLRESGSDGMGVSIRSGTEYEIHLAYVCQAGEVDYGDGKVRECYLRPMRDTEFELIATTLPVRHLIRVTV